MNDRKISFSRELVGDNIQQIVDEGIESEALGYDMVFLPDHLVDINPLMAIFDCWTALGYIAAKTQKILLASGVTDIQRIHPAKIANIVSTLDNLTHGRAVLGIGAGEIMNTKPFGISFEEKKVRLKKLREAIEMIKLLWSSSYRHPVSYEGEFFRLNDAHLSLSPYRKPRPPVYIGSFSSKATLRLVGELADGWYPGSQFSPESFAENVRVIQEECRRANRPAHSIDVLANVPTFVCDEEDEQAKLKARIKIGLKRKIATNQYLVRIYGIEDLRTARELPRDLEYQLASPGPKYDEMLSNATNSLLVSDDALEEVIRKTIAIGSVDECVSTIEKFIRAGATNIFFSSFLATQENYRLIAKKIIPLLRRKA